MQAWKSDTKLVPSTAFAEQHPTGQSDSLIAVALRYYGRKTNRFEEIQGPEEEKGYSECVEMGAMLMCGVTFSCGFSLNKEPSSGPASESSGTGFSSS